MADAKKYKTQKKAARKLQRTEVVQAKRSGSKYKKLITTQQLNKKLNTKHTTSPRQNVIENRKHGDAMRQPRAARPLSTTKKMRFRLGSNGKAHTADEC